MVAQEKDVTNFCEIWHKNRKTPTGTDHKNMNATLNIAVEKYGELEDEDKELFKGQIISYRNLYTFLSQIIPYQDSELEKLFTYLRFLLTKLPRRAEGAGYQLENEVDLQYYRLQKISEGSIDLAKGDPESLKGPTEVGTKKSKDEKVQLSLLVDKLNERFGTDFNKADEFFF